MKNQYGKENNSFKIIMMKLNVKKEKQKKQKD